MSLSNYIGYVTVEGYKIGFIHFVTPVSLIEICDRLYRTGKIPESMSASFNVLGNKATETVHYDCIIPSGTKLVCTISHWPTNPNSFSALMTDCGDVEVLNNLRLIKKYTPTARETSMWWV